MSLLTLFILISTPNITGVVKEFHTLDTKDAEIAFIKTYGLSSQSAVLGYVCAIEMKQAEYSYNPVSKLKIFNRSKAKLDLLVGSNPTDVHLRYIRLVLQEQTPALLNYTDHIVEDKTFLTNVLEVTDDSDFLDEYIRKNTSL
ncbi:MAG: hypothetical protein ACI9JN_000525 [Bacteroidia bacterium]|jgi:hypothetical protein